MAMKKHVAVKGGLHRSGRRRKTEESPPARGLIRPETGTLRLPSDLEETQTSVPPPRIVLVIVVFWLLFIAIITWFVAHMPPKNG
jgi:hypothetical protein